MTKQRFSRHPSSVIQCPVIAVTMGDPGGIGPEVAVRCLKSHHLLSRCRYVLIGSRNVFSYLKKETGLHLTFAQLPLADKPLQKGKIYFWDIGDGNFNPSKETQANGAMALRAISAAAELAKHQLIDAIVTAPLNKASARRADPEFIGHTEFFAKKARAKRYAMMFVGPRLRLTLVTIHVPLEKVSSLISKKLILDKIELTADTLKTDFAVKKPKIAVCALNPHGKECGIEETGIIAPAIRAARKKGIEAAGPYPADQVFYQAFRGEYDALIAMYHDQALGPFKMVHFHDGVNVTLGLSYVRTSPDHGTAYDIAYQGKADPSSMAAALRLAETLALNKLKTAKPHGTLRTCGI